MRNIYLHLRQIASSLSITKAKKEENTGCYYAVFKKPFKFAYLSRILYPAVHSEENPSKTSGGFISDAKFSGDVLRHEKWHRDIHKAYMMAVWKALEAWSESYQSELFYDEGEAVAAALTDLKNARKAAEDFRKNFKDDSLINHPEPGGKEVVTSDGRKILQAINPNWGKAAKDKVSKYRPKFQKQPEKCGI